MNFGLLRVFFSGSGPQRTWLLVCGVRVTRMGDLEDEVLNGMLSLSLTVAHGDLKVCSVIGHLQLVVLSLLPTWIVPPGVVYSGKMLAFSFSAASCPSRVYEKSPGAILQM